MGRLVHFEIHVSDMNEQRNFMERYSDGHFKIGVIMQECLTLEQ